MMLDAMSALDADPGTEVIVLVSKTPAPAVQEKVLAAAQRLSKPVVACLLGARDGVSESGSKVTFVKTTKEAAAAALRLTAAPPDETGDRCGRSRSPGAGASPIALRATLHPRPFLWRNPV